MQFYLEIFFARVVESDLLYCKQIIELEGKAGNPDELVNRHYRQNFGDRPPVLVHSTSWRYEEPGQLIITYLVFSETLNLAGKEPGRIPLHLLKVAQGSTPETPRPVTIGEIHVVSHGFRHLSFLAKNDPVVRNRLVGHPATLSAVEMLPAGLAGGI
jgi:hypothetical protein